jgi:hypothetical protein
MKIISIILLLFLTICIIGQKSNQCEIILHKSILKSTHPKKNFHWIINGQRFDNSQTSFKVKTNYPLVDTILFSSNNQQHFDTIYTRFTPTQHYYFKNGCCDEGFDLVSKNEFDQMQLSEFDDNKRIELIKQTTFTLTVIGLPQNDTVVCYYGDNFGININENNNITKNNTKHTLTIDKNGDTNMITHFTISDNTIENIFVNCYFRFFGKDTVHLTYNLASKKLTFKF